MLPQLNVHPFETIKFRLQTQRSPPNHVYLGFLDCVKKTLQWEGPRGLYEGNPLR
jgi:solute carrier family 25 (mitochondrial carnitine/acylcarnitine transporter), member 20/29